MVGPSRTRPIPGYAGKLTSNDLPRPSEIHQGLGPYGPGCSYATAMPTGNVSEAPDIGTSCYQGQNVDS